MPEADGIYDVYRFTTPRGEVEVTAWSVSREVTTRLAHLGMAMAVILLMGAVAWVIGRSGWGWLERGRGPAALIVLGLLGLVLGVLPIAAAVAVALGLTVQIGRLVARRASRRPAPAGSQ
jgi:Na+/H+-dicarboxylate symporter